MRSRPLDTTSPCLFIGLRQAPHVDFEADKVGMLQLVKSAADRAGIKKRVDPHLFRHSFATEALPRGMNVVQLARILGTTAFGLSSGRTATSIRAMPTTWC